MECVSKLCNLSFTTLKLNLNTNNSLGNDEIIGNKQPSISQSSLMLLENKLQNNYNNLVALGINS